MFCEIFYNTGSPKIINEILTAFCIYLIFDGCKTKLTSSLLLSTHQCIRQTTQAVFITTSVVYHSLLIGNFYIADNLSLLAKLSDEWMTNDESFGGYPKTTRHAVLLELVSEGNAPLLENNK